MAAFSFVTVTFGLRYFGSRDPAHDEAVGCAGTICGAAASPTATVMPDFTPLSPVPSAPPSPRRRAAPAPARTHRPALPTAARVSAPAWVGVHFAADKSWDGGFQGQLTIANHTSATISRWTIAITLPGDRVSSVWAADGQMDGDVLVIQPTSWDPPIRPGGTLNAFFVARGPTISPASCTFDGTTCR
jgi:chitinase